MTIYDRFFFVSKKNVLMYRYIYSFHAFDKYLPNTGHYVLFKVEVFVWEGIFPERPIFMTGSLLAPGMFCLMREFAFQRP